MIDSKDITTKFAFGSLQFTVRGLGVFVGKEKLREKVEALSIDEVRAANRDAWKQRRAADRRAERCHHMTDWDHAAFHSSVAQAVCETTWQRMR